MMYEVALLVRATNSRQMCVKKTYFHVIEKRINLTFTAPLHHYRVRAGVEVCLSTLFMYSDVFLILFTKLSRFSTPNGFINFRFSGADVNCWNWALLSKYIIIVRLIM